ncbi:MAG: DUF4855 domain-containing protein [Armatimonadia bacterium]
MRLLLLCMVVVSAVEVAGAEYPTPQQAGFHHCVLIYECKVRGPEQFAYYVANDKGYLFDAFLFLHQLTKSGKSTFYGDMQKADWESELETWFEPGRDLHALDEALEQAKQKHGRAPRRQVMLSIPYPNAKVKDFGDVDGDGIGENLATSEGRAKVAKWYMEAAAGRFAQAGFRNLEFWGLYWMNEGASDADIAVIRQFSDAVHTAGKRMLWIPWYLGPGWQRWRNMGVDVAIMQPNYAFLTIHRGSIQRNRLIANARFARQEGLGVEIEMPMGWRLPGGPLLFRHYLRDGAADREGYQQAATAYYLNSATVEELGASADPREQALYADLCAYVQNQTAAEPDVAVKWLVRGKAAPWLGDHRQDEGHPVLETETTMPRRMYGTLEVMLYEPEEAWRGTVIVEGQSEAGAPWQPAGWALRSQRAERDGAWQALSVPIAGIWERLRVRFSGVSEPPCVSELTPQPPLFEGASHLAQEAPYTWSGPAQPLYGDSGGELTDGRIPETGFPSGETVGWTGPPVTISFDLQSPTELTHAEVHLQGGSYAAVNWPRSAVMMVSDDEPARRTAGPGAPPGNLTWLGPEPVVIDRKRSETDLDGHLTFRPSRPVRGRYVSFIMEPIVHLMVSEIRLFSGGQNIAAGREYALQPLPSPKTLPETYPDDGRKLTDGQITAFAPRAVVGWRDEVEHTVAVDLQSPCRVDQVLVWTMSGSRYGIVPLSSATVYLSADGQTWQEAGTAKPAVVPPTPSTPCACTVDTKAQMARYVRVVARRGEGWGMLSEIEVRGHRAK